ncbi:DUF1329 domain-containing protein [Burkholderia ubonensis]|uniref:DUF1329 domain-containing protein n=1 Tax=Burkholderia ubonensis TaxID=101571 RepID=UPI000BA5DE60|nr:DUF1329 domain-containing protein [Burkholderia ubonensis]PAJ88825.1 hypothetical protein CJO70_04805 [Burkholderia ubonensis]PAJ92141.1 hypothetical protein CJO69_23775 [Burkholderia ubonensis]PAK09390.1 hypothetical protein CJO67_03155 [Burkholderia ubonensis]RQP64381.1 DUF1329 domain-containing protein [Burkholderia ubonensis]RQP84481.1 DUF1329 domain-containing protein [Burkholderia ubonensis]
MMKKHTLGAVSVIAAALLLVAGETAAADDLTPVGAERGANKDGTVPAFAGRQVTPSGWEYGKVRGEFWKHRNEKPLYSIDAANVDKYASQLTPGQIQLIKQQKGYRMDVYPSHRECQFPEVVEQNSKANLASAKLASNGETLQSAILPGVPFPQPKSGAEAILNYEMRYRGEGIEWPLDVTSISPRPGGGEWIDGIGPQVFFFPSGKLGKSSPQDVDQLSLAAYFTANSPAALAGQAFVQRQYFDKVSETYYYFPGQRRVRRMPAYTHDAPLIGFENQYLIDEANMFNGPIDRFNWKLVGKKDMIVPYNAFGMYTFNAKLRDVATPNGIAAGHRRYEMHRVWVVEATVKPSARHVASKKVFYLHEDSWLALVGEDYDAQGKLWKVRESYPIPVWELGGTCDNEPFVQYDLINGRYVVDSSTIGQGKDLRWYQQVNDPRFKSDFFTAESLRSVSDR